MYSLLTLCLPWHILGRLYVTYGYIRTYFKVSLIHIEVFDTKIYIVLNEILQALL